MTHIEVSESTAAALWRLRFALCPEGKSPARMTHEEVIRALIEEYREAKGAKP